MRKLYYWRSSLPLRCCQAQQPFVLLESVDDDLANNLQPRWRRNAFA
jgi:hypothetical protein